MTLLTPILFAVIVGSAPLSTETRTEATPAERKIQFARSLLAEEDRAGAHDELAHALLERHRERPATIFLEQAEREIARSLELQKEGYAAQRLRVRLLLAKQCWKEALELGHALQKRMPDDVEAYGWIVEACIPLAKLEEALSAAQWMLDLRAEAPASLITAGSLREHSGDPEGAIEMYARAQTLFAVGQEERKADVHARIARARAALGDAGQAEAECQAALSIFPEHPRSLEELSLVHARAGREQEARAWLARRLALGPAPGLDARIAEALAAAAAPKHPG